MIFIGEKWCETFMPHGALHEIRTVRVHRTAFTSPYEY